MKWVDRYIGAPFDEYGLNCWGLVRLVYSDMLGICLPEHGEVSAFDLARSAGLIEQGASSDQWVEPDVPQEFDVVVMRRYGGRIAGHVGIYIGDGMVMHTEKSTDCVIVPRSHVSIINRVMGFRRHKCLS